ncbi:16S rRNA pseudouridine516 synthase [Thermosipho japonicus]|uniref:16S rRNA pseudouridine516 synthase n=1 Tax=Thermosipho japonicus TaxID=90323 RepID=A0A841GSX6_9BACT|nr:pseudouridine synthase [Thermosipho japonicus]MBB6062320.1 16S rRNA pseudouridine516 synthase [Thermosipho japonicus]
MRLDKFLSNAKVGSRKQVKKLIKEKRVKVNGNVVTKPEFNVGENDEVFVDDIEVIPHHNVYIVFNKPSGFTSSKSEYERNIFEFIDHPYLDELHIVGRLDKDVEGLILITNDGNFTHKVISPKSNVEKEYIVKTEGDLTKEMIEIARDGITLNNGIKFKPAKITKIDDETISLVITEGKFHEVKLIVSFLGLKYKKIKRIRIGNLYLNDFNLDLGEWKEIDYNTAKKTLEQ